MFSFDINSHGFRTKHLRNDVYKNDVQIRHLRVFCRRSLAEESGQNITGMKIIYFKSIKDFKYILGESLMAVVQKAF